MTPTKFPCLAWLLMCLCLSSTAVAQPEKSITVTGHGEHAVAADQLEIVGVIKEAAESADDVVVAFRDTRRRALEAIQGLGIDGLGIAGDGPRMALVNPADAGMGGMIVMGAGGGGEPPAIDPEYTVTENITLTVPGFDALDMETRLEVVAELLDTCTSVGIDVTEGGSGGGMGFAVMLAGVGEAGGGAATGVVRLTCSDPAAAQAEARARAIADARAQAEALAQLAGVTLGGVIRIGSTEGVRVLGLSAEPGDASHDSEGRLVYTNDLTVTFEIE